MSCRLCAWLLASAVGVGWLAGCEPAPVPPFDFLVKVTSDKDKVVEGAVVMHNGKKVGVTGSDGTAGMRLHGSEGEIVEFNVQCPAAYESPPKPLSVVLRRVVESKRPEYLVSCPPASRTVVVAVRAENGPNLPVIYLGREIARTDEAGAAHLLLPVRPNDSFSLTLGTSEKGNERLRPQMPVATFMVKGQDDVFSFDQKFSLEKRTVVVRSGPIGPTKLTK